MKPLKDDGKPNEKEELRQEQIRFAPGFAQGRTSASPHGHEQAPKIEPDLARILEAWPTLPTPIRRDILALIGIGE